jgi:hypothetical protein
MEDVSIEFFAGQNWHFTLSLLANPNCFSAMHIYIYIYIYCTICRHARHQRSRHAQSVLGPECSNETFGLVLFWGLWKTHSCMLYPNYILHSKPCNYLHEYML